MKAILTDITKCIGCNECVAACTETNGLGKEIAYRWRSNDGLSSERFTSILRKKGYHVRKQCRHCLEPACVSACPVGALKKTPEGAVVYDDTRCLGCRYCMMACPFGIPRYLWSSPVPYVRKCTMCYTTRLQQGQQPACTEACPEEATIFGERDALLEEAHRRISDKPQLYLPKVFGESEVGGTAVLYLSPIALDFLSLGKPLDDRPMPDRTALAMAAVPPAFLGMGALMGGIYWVIERRRRLRKNTTAEKDDNSEPSSEK
jgi:formate dehydrogenase iron-sulfur subunit